MAGGQATPPATATTKVADSKLETLGEVPYQYTLFGGALLPGRAQPICVPAAPLPPGFACWSLFSYQELNEAQFRFLAIMFMVGEHNKAERMTKAFVVELMTRVGTVAFFDMFRHHELEVVREYAESSRTPDDSPRFMLSELLCERRVKNAFQGATSTKLLKKAEDARKKPPRARALATVAFMTTGDHGTRARGQALARAAAPVPQNRSRKTPAAKKTAKKPAKAAAKAPLPKAAKPAAKKPAAKKPASKKAA